MGLHDVLAGTAWLTLPRIEEDAEPEASAVEAALRDIAALTGHAVDVRVRVDLDGQEREVTLRVGERAWMARSLSREPVPSGSELGALARQAAVDAVETHRLFLVDDGAGAWAVAWLDEAASERVAGRAYVEPLGPAPGEVPPGVDLPGFGAEPFDVDQEDDDEVRSDRAVVVHGITLPAGTTFEMSAMWRASAARLEEPAELAGVRFAAGTFLGLDARGWVAYGSALAATSEVEAGDFVHIEDGRVCAVIRGDTTLVRVGDKLVPEAPEPAVLRFPALVLPGLDARLRGWLGSHRSEQRTAFRPYRWGAVEVSPGATLTVVGDRVVAVEGTRPGTLSFGPLVLDAGATLVASPFQLDGVLAADVTHADLVLHAGDLLSVTAAGVELFPLQDGTVGGRPAPARRLVRADHLAG